MRPDAQFPGTVAALARSLEPGQGQGRMAATEGPGPGGSRKKDFSAQPGHLQSSFTDSLVQKMLEQQVMQEKTMNMVVSLLQEKEASKEKEDSHAKRRHKEEATTSPQEPIMFLEESYRIEDDGHETLDTKLRQKLRPINADPKVWWVKGAFNRVESPVLGASLYTEHLMPGMVAEKTILMAHDRGAHLELKNFLTKNSNVFSESKKKLKVMDDLAGEMHLGIRTDWQSATTVWEAVDAGLNYAAVEHMVRSYNYSPLAMIRCLHESR